MKFGKIFAASMAAIVTAFVVATPAKAALVGVSGDNASTGFAAEIIGAPGQVLNGTVFNTHQQGFDEAQNVLLGADLIGDSGVIASSGMRVDSHMIFLNKQNGVSGNISHNNVVWEFSGMILGVMSDIDGDLEAATSSFLGHDDTTYPSAFDNRGMEGNDMYSILGNELTVNMFVTQPGDWIRVVTVSAVPLPAALPLYGAGVALMGFLGWRRRKNAAA